jgi:hypothetical protein
MPQSEQSLPGVQYTGLSPGLVKPLMPLHCAVMHESVLVKSQLSFWPGSLQRLIALTWLLHWLDDLQWSLHTHIGSE